MITNKKYFPVHYLKLMHWSQLIKWTQIHRNFSSDKNSSNIDNISEDIVDHTFSIVNEN
jgi:hypothetical protein